MDVIKKIERLIALSESPNENEARNAAVQAVKLIRKHGVKLSSGKAEADQAYVNELFRKHQQWAEEERKKEAARRRVDEILNDMFKNHDAADAARRAYKQGHAAFAEEMKARYRGPGEVGEGAKGYPCARCGQAILDPSWIRVGDRLTHVRCYNVVG